MPIYVPCARPGCPEYAVPDGRYCEPHTYIGERQRREHEQARSVRPARIEAKKVYDDRRWRGDCLPQVLARADGACEICGRTIDACGTLQGHHIMGITGTDDDFDPELVIAACNTCHPTLDRRRRGRRG